MGAKNLPKSLLYLHKPTDYMAELLTVFHKLYNPGGLSIQRQCLFYKMHVCDNAMKVCIQLDPSSTFTTGIIFF